jgi:hypothetical protein
MRVYGALPHTAPVRFVAGEATTNPAAPASSIASKVNRRP